jgi:hypothetical protein
MRGSGFVCPRALALPILIPENDMTSSGYNSNPSGAPQTKTAQQYPNANPTAQCNPART